LIITKFPLIIIVVIAMMVALVLLPSFNNSNNNNPTATDQMKLNLEYDRQQLTRTDSSTGGILAATSADILTIQNDGSAKFRKLLGAPYEKTFTLSSDDMKQLRGLIFDTGFMNIPTVDYKQKEGLANVTEYTLKINANETSKIMSWVNTNSYNGTIPPLITNVGFTLDNILSKYT
jgi:hypothetical protein